MWDRIETDWTRFREHARHQWARLGDEQLDAIGGRRDRLRQRVRDAYGVSDEEADKQIAAWEADLRAREQDPEHVTLDNPGPEFGDHDRPGGAGLPTNQGGGRDAGGLDADGADAGGRAPGNEHAIGGGVRPQGGRIPPGAAGRGSA